MKRTLTAALGLAALAAVPMMTARPAQAATIQLGFILDSSGSIGASNWGIITTGLKNAINTLIPIGGADTYELSVVSFSNSATTVVNHALITDAASRTAAANAVGAAAYLGSTTNYTAAFTALEAALQGGVGISSAAKTYINFATDGDPNPDSANGLSKRTDLINAGVDNISIEGIALTTTQANNLKTNYCYPGPCDDTVPFDFPVHGFYIGVANATEYATAIANKIQLVTCTTNCGPLGENPIPEPASLAVFGLGLLGIGLATRRRNRIH